MTVVPFDGRLSSQPSPAVGLETPARQSPDDGRKQHAVTELLEHGVLSHAFGQHREYKVRTTLTTRPTWQYRCCVLRHGKPMKGSFFPLIAELRPPKSRGANGRLALDDMRLSFAEEAVEVHFTRCAALREYLVLSTLYDRPPSKFRGWYTLLIPLIGGAAVIAYGVWGYAFRTEGIQLPGGVSPVIAERPLAQGPWAISFPTTGRTTSQDSMIGRSTTADPIDSVEMSKAVTVNDILTLQPPPEKPGQALPTTGSARSNLQVGDTLHLTAWIQRISRAPDSAYHLHVSQSRNAGSRVLVAVVPSPTSAKGSLVDQGQLQATRSFIRQELLRQQEPSPRGSVMQRPAFVQLTGQLSRHAAPAVPASRAKQSQITPARWEIHPLLDVQFATPSEHAQSQ